MEYQMNEINFLISPAWAKGGIDVGDPTLKIEKCCEGGRAPQKSEINLVHVIFHLSRLSL